MGLITKNGYFQKNGKPFFLLSGEIHYFRLDPRLWEKHLHLLKQAGANTTSTYIPWDWHEYEEGKFDFNGDTHPARNIVRYIELCKNVGLDLIVKPGPYILAEYVHHGIPAWLVRRNVRSALALDERGNPIAGTRVMVPYRVSVPTPLGVGIMQATQFVSLPYSSKAAKTQ